jgi:hypothetical protein
MTPTPNPQRTPEEQYLNELTRFCADLRRLADKVERVGTIRSDHPVNGQRQSATSAVYAIEAEVQKIGTRLLWWFAIEADYENARMTSAQMLDQAATAILPMLEDLRSDRLPEDESVLIAEEALRGAGIIRPYPASP